jgi:hypothetical protein
LEEDKLTPAAAEKLQGRLQWCGERICGASGRAHLWPIRRRIDDQRIDYHRYSLNGSLREALNFFYESCSKKKLQQIPLQSADDDFIIIQCDGCTRGVGGLLYDLRSQEKIAWKLMFADIGLADVNTDISEMFAVIVSAILFLRNRPESFGRDVVLFEDNNGTTSRILQANPRTSCLWTCVDNTHVRLWTERLDSDENLSDLPSRGTIPHGFREIALPEKQLLLDLYAFLTGYVEDDIVTVA